jgi:toxin YhaV
MDVVMFSGMCRYDDASGLMWRNIRLEADGSAFKITFDNRMHSEYRQGNTLGGQHKHWFRAKFFQQYRLFFRYHAGSKVIVFAWVNDDQTKRAFESSDDAYRVFRKMLESGHPPDDWDQLLRESEVLKTSSKML